MECFFQDDTSVPSKNWSTIVLPTTSSTEPYYTHGLFQLGETIKANGISIEILEVLSDAFIVRVLSN